MCGCIFSGMDHDVGRRWDQISSCRNFVADEIGIIEYGSVTQAPVVWKNHTVIITSVVVLPGRDNYVLSER